LAFVGTDLAIYAGGRVLIPRTRSLRLLARREGFEASVGKPLFEPSGKVFVEDPALKHFRDCPELLRPFTSVQELYNECEPFFGATAMPVRRGVLIRRLTSSRRSPRLKPPALSSKQLPMTSSCGPRIGLCFTRTRVAA
jgi:hypothetical protein